MRDTKVFLVPLVVETNDDCYLVRCPDIQGAFAEGDTVEEAIFNCVEVIKMIADYRAERGESLSFHVVDLTPETRLTLSFPVGVSAVGAGG